LEEQNRPSGSIHGGETVAQSPSGVAPVSTVKNSFAGQDSSPVQTKKFADRNCHHSEKAGFGLGASTL
jgi:hypothetical protein